MIELSKFWDFVTERQEIWYRRRVLDEAWPLTRDPILDKHRFTNIYRCLDKGTLFALYEILAPIDSYQGKVFQTVAYRLLNRIDSYKDLRQSVSAWSRDKFLASVKERIGLKRPIMTAAFIPNTMVTGGLERGVVAKIGAVLEIVRGRIAEITRELRAVDHPGTAHGIIRNIAAPEYTVGPFISYQILLDLMYPALERNSAMCSQLHPNCWVYMGPGSTKSIGEIGKQHGMTPMEVCMNLYINQALPLHERNFKFLRRAQGGEYVHLSLADMEHALCEWYKYKKLATGGVVKANKGPGNYTPPSPVPQWLEVPR